MFFEVIDLLFSTYYFLLIVRVIGSWIPQVQHYKFMHFVYYYTEPYLAFFRRLIPPLGMIDLSALVAFLALGLLKSFVLFLFL
ncbi:MAG: YggT family protein [Chlamydiota bacterium]